MDGEEFRLKRMLSLLMTFIMLIGTFVVPVSATQPVVKLVLELDGEIKVGNTIVANILCRENPGIGAAQFTLAYDRDVLKCVGCTAGPVLREMMHVVNPNHSDGAIVVGASATALDATGIMAKVTFEVLAADDPGFQLVNVRFGAETGDLVAYEILGLNQGADEGESAQPEQSQTPTKPQTPSGSSGGGHSKPTQGAGQTAEAECSKRSPT